MADGLTAELKAYLLDALGPAMAARAARPSSEPLLVDYVSVHTPEEDAIQTRRSCRDVRRSCGAPFE